MTTLTVAAATTPAGIATAMDSIVKAITEIAFYLGRDNGMSTEVNSRLSKIVSLATTIQTGFEDSLEEEWVKEQERRHGYDDPDVRFDAISAHWGHD